MLVKTYVWQLKFFLHVQPLRAPAGMATPPTCGCGLSLVGVGPLLASVASPLWVWSPPCGYGLSLVGVAFSL